MIWIDGHFRRSELGDGAITGRGRRRVSSQGRLHDVNDPRCGSSRPRNLRMSLWPIRKSECTVYQVSTEDQSERYGRASSRLSGERR